MVKCPKCGAEARDPFKTWSMVGKPDKSGERFRLTMGMFECPLCGTKFREVAEKEKVSIKGAIKKIRGIEEGLVQVLGTLREKIQKLESEKADLLTEIEELKKAAEARAEALETEIATLRKEVKALKELFSATE